MSYPQPAGRFSGPVKKITSFPADTLASSLTISAFSPGLCFQPLYLQAICHQRVNTPQDTRPAIYSVQIKPGSLSSPPASSPVSVLARNFRPRNPVSNLPDLLKQSPGNQPGARPQTTGHLSQLKISGFSVQVPVAYFTRHSWMPDENFSWLLTSTLRAVVTTGENLTRLYLSFSRP